MKLYWLICAGLLLAGTVEAGEPAQCEWVLASGHLRNSCELLEIDPGVNPILQNASFLACYQRMREAMQIAYRYIGYREFDMNIVPLSVMPEEDWNAWKITYQECVK